LGQLDTQIVQNRLEMTGALFASQLIFITQRPLILKSIPFVGIERHGNPRHQTDILEDLRQLSIDILLILC